MRKITSLILVALLIMALSCHAYAAEVTTEIIGEYEDFQVLPRKVDLEHNFSIDPNGHYSTSFNLVKWFDDDHNSFNVIVSSVSGAYRVVVKNETTTIYDSGKVTADTSKKFAFVNPEETYRVYVYNESSSLISGNIKISSYYDIP